jgi:Protein of unknown function (DUF1553)/Protein of unknown function (DUF1549)
MGPRFVRLLLGFTLAAAASPLVLAEPPGETWWSFRPLTTSPVPDVSNLRASIRNPIDAFILARLKVASLEPAPEADRRVLIRRLSFDLIGLPPTPAEISTFLADADPDAYERLVERLLASPHFGERWARHWMDCAHFAETHGHDQDRIRPNAWRYRDYLVAAFNADTPYARFVQEQVAADALFPNEPRLIPALGFLSAGPWDESSLRDIREDSIDRQAGHYLDRDDLVTTVMSTFQSLTVHCARCHDHKSDPIPQTEYYGLQAVFAGVGRADRAYDPDPQTACRRRALAETLRVVGLNDPTLGAFAVREVAKRQQADLPAVYAVASDFAADGGHKPSPGPRPVHLLMRGDIRRPGPVVEPAALNCLPRLSGRLEISASAAEGERRAALARWLTRPDNPLTWRSIVNRVWHYHFGRGLVETPNDFGHMGGRPSHPELLDWLACRFRDGGGSLKNLHRLIVTSATYRQSSRGFSDSDNRLLAHGPRARLDAEQVRDAVLLASGRLDQSMGRPSDRQFVLKPGRHVTPVVDYGKFDWDRQEGHRRSVYRLVFRTLPDPFVACLDGADASQLTPVRNVSVTAPQALALLNSEFVLVHSAALARLLEEQSPERDRRIVIACERVWGRPPTKPERDKLAGYAEKHGLANLCRLLFNASDFLFVD